MTSKQIVIIIDFDQAPNMMTQITDTIKNIFLITKTEKIELKYNFFL